ncbi:MAG: TolC family outer membrane protein [Campylobacterota bacterium]|nr:TolC family outer membrane protein [Campylobacterota bacterium]
MQGILKVFLGLSISLTTILQGQTLKEDIAEVLKTNPVVEERLRNFRMTQQDLNIARSEYYPIIDFRATAGYTNAGEIKDEADDGKYDHNVVDEDYKNYETSLKLTQNIFDGFATTHKVDYQKARILAAGYKYIETSNDMAFKMTTVYINVLRANKLLQTARENVQINEDIYKKVKKLFDGGLTTDSEVKKIEASLSLARSNLTVQRNNALDKEYSFKRVLGRMPIISEMEEPEFNIKMPTSLHRATLYAVENNPSLLVSNYNIKGAQALRKQRKKDYYPKLDFIVEQSYNDVSERNSFDSPDDRFTAKFVLTYNLYRGGADKANVQKHISMINQEIDIKRDLKRQTIEGLELSWNSYMMVDTQLKDLNDYSQFSETTLSLYKEEYDLGRRTLLDLLTAQSDVISSRSQVIEAQYDSLFAKYRILDAMGLLVLSINGSADEFTSKVNISQNSIAAEQVLDTLPIRLDVDNDNIVDSVDLCENSVVDNNIMPYGCVKLKRDNDKDGVLDIDDRCPLTKEGEKVNADGCVVETVEEEALDEDGGLGIEDLDSDEELSIEKVTLDDEI